MISQSRLDKCENIYMNGCADAVSGDVESPVGHFYRVGRYIVQTDNLGFHHLNEYDTENDAKEAFDSLDNLFAKWGDNSDDEFSDVGNPQ
jgi:hypothetical protein